MSEAEWGAVCVWVFLGPLGPSWAVSFSPSLGVWVSQRSDLPTARIPVGQQVPPLLPTRGRSWPDCPQIFCLLVPGVVVFCHGVLL